MKLQAVLQVQKHTVFKLWIPSVQIRTMERLRLKETSRRSPCPATLLKLGQSDQAAFWAICSSL